MPSLANKDDGDILIYNIDTKTQNSIFTDYSSKEYEITCLDMNREGTMIAAATTEGKTIEVFNIKTMKILHKLTRGSIPKHICFISFQLKNKELIVNSENGTIHLFKLQNTEEIKKENEKKGYLEKAMGLFKDQSSYAKFRINNEETEQILDKHSEGIAIKYISWMIDNHLVLSVSSTGYMYIGSIKEAESEVKLEETICYMTQSMPSTR